ncbi:MAG: O-antigen ligase family protein [Bacillota bacterium]
MVINTAFIKEVVKIKRALDILFLIGILSALTYFVNRSFLIYIIVIMCGLLLTVYYLISKINRYILAILFLSLFTILYLLKFLFYQSTGDLSSYILLFAQIGFALYILENSNGLKVYRITYLILSFCLLYYFLSGTSPHHISKESSANIVNYIYLAFSILMTGINYHKNSMILITPAILSTLVSFWSYGRAGIIASFIFLIGVLFLKYKNKINKLVLGLVIIMTSLISYTIYNFLMEMSSKILFDQGNTFIKGSERSNIIDAYFQQLNIDKVLFGLDYNHQHFFAGYTNLHNSYLDIHAKFGLGGILILIVLFTVLIRFLITKQYLYFILTFSLLLRGATDSVMLGEMYDFVLIFLVLVCLGRITNKKVRESRSNTESLY